MFMENTHNLRNLYQIIQVLLSKNKNKTKTNSNIWLGDNVLQNTSPLGKSTRKIHIRKFLKQI